MRVIVHAEDLSGRRDDGYYSKPKIADALDIFFENPDEVNFSGADGQEIMTRSEAESVFDTDGKVIFYNRMGERVVITRDPSA